ncbi:porin [Caballeronia sp. LZ034LL]|uniref:porin n=1 Tax=Caballeronia sp. LZ034LL TaxID=3038567 RepID=UPI002863EEFB|nr:porin [Caballeronia sp. LZ034LL]MDR5836174.1 porin [Caballeronia sp. LZ034LL]
MSLNQEQIPNPYMTSKLKAISKKKTCVWLSAPLALCGVAHAESAVTLFGIIDDGLTYTTNVGGKSAWQMQNGIAQGSRWGMVGKEDLGGGTAAVFRLENGFNVNTGTLGQGSRLFGRAAYVGLSNTRYGTLTLGRQNEFMGEYVGAYGANGNWGILLPHAGDLDNTGIDFRVSNAVRYVSPTLAGVTVGALYSFGGTPGQLGLNAVESFGINYSSGPLSVAAAYTAIDHPATAVPEGVWTASNPVDGNYGIAAGHYRSTGISAQYTFGQAKIAAVYTNTRFSSLDPSLGARIDGNVTFNIGELVAAYNFTPSFQIGGAYSYTAGKVSATGATPRYHILGGVADYFLSKRTDVYFQTTWMRAAGDATVAGLAPVIGASDGKNQLIARVGIRSKF